MGNQDLWVTPKEERRLTLAPFQRLADLPPETQWYVNLDSAQTRRAYPLRLTPTEYHTQAKFPALQRSDVP